MCKPWVLMHAAMNNSRQVLIYQCTIWYVHTHTHTHTHTHQREREREISPSHSFILKQKRSHQQSTFRRGVPFSIQRPKANLVSTKPTAVWWPLLAGDRRRELSCSLVGLQLIFARLTEESLCGSEAWSTELQPRRSLSLYVAPCCDELQDLVSQITRCRCYYQVSNTTN